MNALVIETAFLGDAIISLSLAHAIKTAERDSRVTYLVRPGVNEVIAASPDVDSVLTFDKHGSESGTEGIRKKAAELNACGFDTLFLLHASVRSQRLASLVECNAKIGFEAMKHAGLTHTIIDANWQNRYERAIVPLEAVFPTVEITLLPRLCPSPILQWDFFFSEFEIVIALAPGSVWETKKWGNSKFLELAKRLTQQGMGVVVIGGSEDVEIGREVVAVCAEGTVLNLAGVVSFIAAMDAVRRSKLLVSNDSAPAHGAVAVGTKVLTMFGPTVPAFGFAPPLGCGEVMELLGLWCRPCTPHGGHTCPVHTHECMERIEVGTVLSKVTEMLLEKA